jgi:hypothetical protein
VVPQPGALWPGHWLGFQWGVIHRLGYWRACSLQRRRSARSEPSPEVGIATGILPARAEQEPSRHGRLGVLTVLSCSPSFNLRKRFRDEATSAHQQFDNAVLCVLKVERGKTIANHADRAFFTAPTTYVSSTRAHSSTPTASIASGFEELRNSRRVLR